MSLDVDQINQQLRDLSESLHDASDLMRAISQSQAGYKATEQQAKAASSAMGTLDKASKETSSAMSNLTKSAKEAAQMEVTRSQQTKKATEEATRAVGAFASAILSTEKGLSKYNEAITSATSALGSLAASAGTFGRILGAGIKVAGEVTAAMAEQTDAAMKARDELYRMGAAGALTTKELIDMGHQAGLTTEQLSSLTKPLQSINTGLISLGGSVGDGAKIFAKMTATVTEAEKEERKRFSRLGVSYEDLIQHQADFVKLQEMSGIQATRRYQTEENLRKASLNYVTNLHELASITGEDINSIKRRQQEAAYAAEAQIRQFQLRREGNIGQADAEQQLLSDVATFGDPKMLAAFQEFIATGGNITSQNGAQMLFRGMDLQDITGRLRAGDTTVAMDAINQYIKGTEALMTGSTGDVARFSSEFRDTTGMSDKAINLAASRYGTDLEEQRAKAAENVANAMESGSDAAADFRATVVETEITTRLFTDSILAQMNPMINGMSDASASAFALASAAASAAAALVGIAGAGAISGGLGGNRGGNRGGRGGNRSGRGGFRGGRGVGAGVLAGTALSMGADAFTEEGSGMHTAASVAGAAIQGASMGALFGPLGIAAGAVLGTAYGTWSNRDAIFGEKEEPVSVSDLDARAKEFIKQNEGYRAGAYTDTTGNSTIGYGHNLTASGIDPSTLSAADLEALFEEDYTKHKAAAERIPGYESLDDNGKMALIDLTYNMGPGWINNFPAFAAALESGDRERMVAELANSKWAEQVKGRSTSVMDLLGGNSITAINTSVAAAAKVTTSPESQGTVAPEAPKQAAPIVGAQQDAELSALLQLLSKMDAVVGKLSDNNDILDRILRHSLA